MELRDYQLECAKAIDDIGSGRGLVSMATGLGKTVVFSRIKRKGRVLILSHREELVTQPIRYYDCPCGIEQGENRSHGEEVVSASVQSLARRLDNFSPDDFDMIITDEAHHAAAPTYKKIYAYFRPRLHIGFTATPNRGDKVRLDDVFDKIIFTRDLKWGIINGWLTDVRCLRVNVSYDLRGVKRRLGDFVAADLDRAVNTAPANKEVADIYKKYAKGQTLIFASGVAHANNIAAETEGAVAVSASTENRAAIIEDFKKGKIRCLVNCMVFTEGTDLPMIETIIIARPTQNQSLYAQMVGRGLRRYEGKRFLTLIDCVGVSGNLEICTAPSLMGLDISDVPKSRERLLEGMLTDMPKTVEKACDCPENWILNVQAVRLFAADQKVNAHRINWTKKSNGDLVYQFTDGDRIGVKSMNALGKTRLMFYRYEESAGGFVYSETEETDLQTALDRAYAYFLANYEDERKLWDLTEYYGWQNEPATQKQLEFIKARLPEGEWAELNEGRTLTKGDASQILNVLALRNSSPARLAALHARKAAEKRAKEEERERLSKLKIRYVLTKKGRALKYYAVRAEDDLAVFDDWGEASAFIGSLPENSCRFKGFPTKEAAVDFLRGR